VVAAAAALLAAAATVPFGIFDVSRPEVPVALAILVAVAAALAGGVWAGLAAAVVGWTLFFVFVADQTLAAVLALPPWVAAALGTGLAADRFRRSRGQRALLASEMEAILQASPEGVIRVAHDGRIERWSSGAAQIYGYLPEEIEGSEISVLTGADRSDATLELIERAREGASARHDQLVHRRKDGGEVSVRVAAVPVRDAGDSIAAVSVVVSDITEGLRAREHLDEGERKRKALLESLPLVTLLYAESDRSRPVYASPQIESLLGYSAKEWLAEPALFSRLLHPDDRERALAEIEGASEAGRPLRSEYRLLTRDGRAVWVREEAGTVLGPTGESLYTQSFLLPIDELKQAGEERERLLLAERAAALLAAVGQERLDLLRRASEVLAASDDSEMAIRKVAELTTRRFADWCAVDLVDSTGALSRLTLGHAEHIKASSTLQLGPQHEPAPLARKVVRSRRSEAVPSVGGQPSTGEDVVPLPGVEAESAVAVPLLANGRAVGAITFVSTVAGRTYGVDDVALAEDLARQMALAIEGARLHEEAEERADAARVLTYVADGVFLLDRGGAIRLWNPAAEAITGWTRHAVVGRSAADAIPGWHALVDRIPTSASPDPGHTESVLPLETDRGERWISISGVDFFGGTVYAFRDLTEARRLDELKAEFVATASHELRTPLAAVYGAAQTLRRHDFALDESGRERFVSIIAEESERLSRIVNEILLANQLDAGRLDLATEPFDPVDLAERVAEAARMHAPHGISLELVAPEPVTSVDADRDKMRQVLVNLVENAVKYSPNGGRVQVGVQRAEDSVRFWVSDEGLGIPDDEQGRIFEKFYRLDPEMTRGVGGTGLGLYICTELVERMGGHIWVESSEGKGSRFVVELPATEPVSTSGGAVSSTEARS
jgi:two-component system phosphate regulon sensor histidine kinase PhoR